MRRNERLSNLFGLMIVFTTVRGKISVELSGAGASFPNQVYERLISGYKHYRSDHIVLSMTYESIGSGDGKERITGENEPFIHFAGSDYPLTAEARRNNPNLIQFPTIAGAIVLAYNIPSLNNLTLSMETVLGIYNGTFQRWDHPKIKELNPNSQMPKAEIVVLARSDTSGTTHSFTHCLSSYSMDWKTTYGTFSQGLDVNTKAIFWNQTVVNFFGNTNSGMTGMGMSLYNSIAYMSIADAIKANFPFADIQKSPGNIVRASVESVQKAITYANGSFDIANIQGPEAYPFASYSFFITRRVSLSSCDAMVEFVRFVEWIYHTDSARENAVDLNMVPLDFITIEHIREQILKTIICQGEKVWDTYLRQLKLEKENPTYSSWKLPTYIGMAVMTVVIMTLSILYCQQQYRIHRELLNDKWKINASEIITDRAFVNEFIRSTISRQDKPLLSYAECTLADQAWLECNNMQGIYEGAVIMISETRISNMSLKHKRMALLLRDNIKHLNIMPFVGLSIHRLTYFGLYSGASRCSIIDAIRNPKYHIQTDCVVSYIGDLAEGMKYLHNKGIVHGNLQGSKCMLDITWTLKVTGWCEYKLQDQKFDDSVTLDKTNDLVDDFEARKLFWTAPELIKLNRPPSQASDVYSFGMVVQEMLTCEEPYNELTNMPCDIITAVVKCCVRPKFSANASGYIRRLLEGTWEMDPSGRPSFAAICQGLKHAYPAKVSILDSIIESSERYVAILEERLKAADKHRKRYSQTRKESMFRTAPSCITDMMLADGGGVEPRTIPAISGITVVIANIEDVVARVTKDGIFNTLKHFYNGLDQTLGSDELYIAERHAEKTVYAIGLPTFNKKHAHHACSIANKIRSFCQRFNRQNLEDLNTGIKFRMGISSSSALAGFMISSGEPRYTVIGKCFADATLLAMSTQDNTVLISHSTFEEVQKTHTAITAEAMNEARINGCCYHLQPQQPVDSDVIRNIS